MRKRFRTLSELKLKFIIAGSIAVCFQKNECMCGRSHVLCCGVCDCVQSIILLPHMMGALFMVVTLIRLIVSEPEH